MLFVPKIQLDSFSHFVSEAEPKERYMTDLYEVSVNGVPCDVRRCDVSAMPFNREFPGHQRSKDQTEQAAYLNVFGDEPITLTVTCKNPFEKVVCRPLSKGVLPTHEGNTVTFTLTEHGGYVLEPYEDHHTLHIFYNPPLSCEGQETATYSFGPGIHFVHHLELKSGESVYVDPEAYVYTNILAHDAEHIRIFGGGVLDDSTEERVNAHCYSGQSIGNLRFYRCRDVRLEGVTLVNAANWVVSFFECNGVVVDGIHIVGQWRYNTDGMDICNTSNITVKNAFIRSFDDTISIKGLKNFPLIENITVENCVLWCDWGKTLETGIETMAKELRRFTFKNCDCIHNCWGGMTVSNGNWAYVHDLLYEDVRVELQQRHNAVLQETEDQVYQAEKDLYATFVHLRNNPWRHPLVPEAEKSVLGKIADVTYRNITALPEPGCPKPIIVLRSEDAETPIERVTFDGVFVGGKKIASPDEIDFEMTNTKEVCFL